MLPYSIYSINGIKTLIDTINHVNDSIQSIAATTEEISAQSETIKNLADDIHTDVNNL